MELANSWFVYREGRWTYRGCFTNFNFSTDCLSAEGKAQELLNQSKHIGIDLAAKVVVDPYRNGDGYSAAVYKDGYAKFVCFLLVAGPVSHRLDFVLDLLAREYKSGTFLDKWQVGVHLITHLTGKLFQETPFFWLVHID